MVKIHFIYSPVPLHVGNHTPWLTLARIYFMRHRWCKVKSHKLFQTILLSVSTVVLCAHKNIFPEWYSLCSMKHCVQNTLALGILERVHHSIPVTNHLPHGGGSCFHCREFLTHRLKYHRMPRHKPLERPVHVSAHNFCLFHSFIRFPLVISCAESYSSINQFS